MPDGAARVPRLIPASAGPAPGPSPLVSVVVPVYNGALHVAAALDSVIDQTYRPLEIVVVDDGSTDASAAVIAGYGDAVRCCPQPNQGSGAARNRGVALARGDLLAFLDQDDVWVRDKLSRQVAALAADPALDAVTGMVAHFYSPELGPDFRARVRCPARPLPGYLPSAFLIRRAAFARVGGFGDQWKLVEWAEWVVRALAAGITLRVLPDVVARRRLHEANKGLALRAFRDEYPRILKAVLDRRRTAARGPSALAPGEGAEARPGGAGDGLAHPGSATVPRGARGPWTRPTPR
jgi:glycosyltransferase involved in cell wall biosynthesis